MIFMVVTNWVVKEVLAMSTLGDKSGSQDSRSGSNQVEAELLQT